MPRQRPATRIDDFVAATVGAFVGQGYRQTKVSDVAARLEVAQGTIYTYVESKQALLHLCIQRLCDRDHEQTLPVPTPEPGATATLIARELPRRMARPILRAALAKPRADDVRAELEGVVLERYESIRRSRHLLALIESVARDLPEIHAAYYAPGRRPFLADLTSYLQARIDAGQLRVVPDVEVAGRFVNESITWFAWKRIGDPGGETYDEDAVRATLVDLVTAGLVERGR